ncbi:MAG: ATPase, T2SS/T4P/T4SS family [Syntrophales bacterium]|nr:ATPase, T2SS/T4P/T4SS family [Syntrophales bacterium]
MPDEAIDQTDGDQEQTDSLSYRKIGHILIEAGLVTKEQIEKALLSQRSGNRKKIGRLLIDMGYITEDQFLMALAEKIHRQIVDLDRLTPDRKTLAAIPGDLCRGLRIFPIEDRGAQIIVATSDLACKEIENTIQTRTNRKISTVLATSDQISRALIKYYSDEPDHQIADPAEEVMEESALYEYETETSDISQEIDSRIITLVNEILADAYAKRASDIHFDSGIRGTPFDVRFRVDGICYLASTIPEISKRAVISRIKIISNLDIAERRKPQSGKFMVMIHGEKVEFRVEVTPTVDNNENIVLRILAKSKPVPIDQLGLSPYNLAAFRDMITKPQGVVLCVGPTGSGKTTTLHSALGHINKPEITIWTAEDPVEIRQPGLKQVQINNKIGFTFSEALRSFLRADPDVIMIGEMRDAETAKITLEASLTGHLVFSTLHTNSAAETIVRIIDMGIPFYNFADALLGIVAQRLTRRLCNQCKQPYHPDEEEYNNLRHYYDPIWAKKHGLPDLSPETTLWKPKGCSLCNGKGYYGRIALHEIIVASPSVKKAIRQGAAVEDINEISLGDGMRTLRMDGITKVLEGITDHEQVSRVCL